MIHDLLSALLTSVLSVLVAESMFRVQNFILSVRRFLTFRANLAHLVYSIIEVSAVENSDFRLSEHACLIMTLVIG